MSDYQEQYEENNILNGLTDGNIHPQSLDWEKISKHYNFPEDVLWKYRERVFWEDVFADRSPARPLSPDFVKKVKKYLETKVGKLEKEVEEYKKLEKCIVSLPDDKKDEKIGKWFKIRPPLGKKEINHVIGHDENGYIYEQYMDMVLKGTYNGWNDFEKWDEIPPPKQFTIEKPPHEVIEYDEFQFLEIEG